MENLHTPVLLKEAVEAMNIRPDGQYIDCTLGEGGHSIEILNRLSERGRLLSLDADQNALDFVQTKYPQQLKKGSWQVRKTNFSRIADVANELQIVPDGILMDLGLSSRQLESRGRGFSYQNPDEQLDMRMDQQLSVKAGDLLKVLTETELEKLFRNYGEERYARKIARMIKKSGNIETVGDLTSLIYKAMPVASRRKDSHHPARRVFQALRIAVNDELNSLKEALDESFKILNRKGRIAVITFHSLEDRIVKEFFEQRVNEGNANLIGEVIAPSEEEININNRARSAKLRVLEKI
jgi:16S rRNA (cytosine1402-N4)-methyltransferase